MQITTDPALLAGSLCLGLPESVTVQALGGDLPSDVRLVLGSLAAPLATIPLAVAGAVASAIIPAATVAAAHVALDGRPVPVVLIAGAGAGLDQIAGGRLWWRQESWGTDDAQSLGSVVVGPAGPTAVSADAGNAASLGSDGLIFVSPTALPTSSSAVIADDTPAVPADGESATYFVTSAVAWPEGLVWSTDPDGDTEPTVTETALVSMFTVGGLTYAVMGATFLAPIVATVPAAPGSFLTVADADSITLTWAAPANGGSAITGYKVYRGTVSGALTLRATLGDVLTYDDTTATPGTTYYYTASAVNAIGEGPQSMEAGAAISTGPTLILADDFNRANNGTINEAGSNPGSTSTGNVPWQSSVIHTWGIVGNGMVGLDSHDVAYVETGEADVAVEVKIGSGKQNYDGIAVRCVDSSNYCRIGWAPELFVYKVTAGSTTVIQPEGSPVATFVAGDVLRAEAIGSSWTIKKNGATVFTFTDATHQTGTKHGLVSASSIITAQRWDDFKVYAL